MPSKWQCGCGKDWPCREAVYSRTPFQFLNLPAELRLAIYEQVMVDDPPPCYQRHIFVLPSLNTGMNSKTPRHPPWNLLGVSRLIRQETQQIYIREYNTYLLYGCDKAYERNFRDLVSALSDTTRVSLRAILSTTRLSLSPQGANYILPPSFAQIPQQINQRRPAPPLTPPEDPFERNATAVIRLTTTPPKVTITLARRWFPRLTITNNTVVPTPSSQIRYGVWGTQRDRNGVAWRKAQRALQEAMQNKLDALFGFGRGSRAYSRGDLAQMVGVWVACLEECFGGEVQKRKRRYWLRERRAKD